MIHLMKGPRQWQRCVDRTPALRNMGLISPISYSVTVCALSFMKRTPLPKKGKSDRTKIMDDIQAYLRLIVIKRDGGCILAGYKDTGMCGPTKSDGKVVLQAEHLNSRSHMVSFADSRNVVCLCQRHHIYWKPQNSRRYWEIIEEQIGPNRWEYFKKVEADKRPYKVDLKLELVALKEEYKILKA